MNQQKILSFLIVSLLGLSLSCSCQSVIKDTSNSSIKTRNNANNPNQIEIDISQSTDDASLNSLKYFVESELEKYANLDPEQLIQKVKVGDIEFPRSIFLGFDDRIYSFKDQTTAARSPDFAQGSIVGSLWGEDCQPVDIMDIYIDSDGQTYDSYQASANIDCINPMKRVMDANHKSLLFVRAISAIASGSSSNKVKVEGLEFSVSESQIQASIRLKQMLNETICQFAELNKTTVPNEWKNLPIASQYSYFLVARQFFNGQAYEWEEYLKFPCDKVD